MNELFFLLQAQPQGDWGLFIGRWHPLLVHLPIGMLMVAFLLEGLSKYKQLGFLAPSILPVLIFGALAAIASCIAGYLLSLSGGYEEDALMLHQWLGIGVAVVSVVLVILRRYAVLKKAWFPLSGLMILLLSAAGHYGGGLTHGDDYLTAAMPPFFGKRAKVAEQAVINPEEAKVYEDLVQPILEQKCYGCHNAQKLKGGLRLDGMAHIRAGGEHGPVLKDSLPEASELYKRLILPENDDLRMPPKGKPQLTPQQLEIIYWWIAQGAPDSIQVKALRKSPRIQLVLESMQPSGGVAANPFIPGETPGAAAEKDIAALEALDVKVMPVAAQDNFLSVNCINAATFGNREAKLLEPLRSQLVWLKLSNTQITDSALHSVAQLTQLTRLQLEYTAITDEGLKALAGCKQLKYLNLVGTKVTDKGLMVLKDHPSLKEIYVYKTSVTPAVLKALPNIRIDTGGYQLPALATDTAVFRKAKT